jgi:hypothetical protein
MRNRLGVCFFTGLLLSGCGALDAREAGRAEQKAPPKLQQSNLAAARKIELTCCYAGGIPGAPYDLYKLELQAGGPCRATVTHGNNFNSNGRTTAEFELPAETFAECVRLLTAADFFNMKDSAPEVLFENACSSVSVTCDGEFSHAVSVTHPAPAPKGFDDLFALASEAEKRGKPAFAGPPPPPGPPTPDLR